MTSADEAKNIAGNYDSRGFTDGIFDETISIEKYRRQL